ncbi:hypothetical protein D9756_008825 [Leucocoprinus leucothites]|uniref:Uncharacterized protein n=1 Tax=Leucocoprinus leucothites TaxID=201217 RepID=A0A8H5CYT4_9AGAR|nr:hypothetical protein D9756_008825 [Leucoagaricus leucothites]
MKGPAELTHGPFLIGLFFNILLQGILIAQAYFYYTKYRKDLRWLRLLVLVLFLVELVNTAFNCFYIYQSLVINFADPTGTHFIFNLNLSKLYSNSLMSSLNARSTPSSTRDNGMSTFEVAPSSGFAFQSQLDSAKPGWMRDEESSLQNQTSTKVTSTRSEWSLNPQGCHTLPPGSDVSAHAGYSHASDETGGIGATKADSGLEDKARSTTVELGINHDTDEHRFGN